MVNDRKVKMKNELGIEVCCENCECSGGGEYYCYKSRGCNYDKFTPISDVYEARIKELQAQLETAENAYHKTLDAYHDVAEQLEELKAKKKKEEINEQ